MKISILPSLLSADFGYLADGALKAQSSGGDELHIDVMDAHFAPNLSMGPDVIKMADRTLKIPLNVHIMMTRPDKYVDKFIDAGSDILLIHIEADCNIAETLKKISARGIKAGITLNPGTPISEVFPLLEHVDEVLLMSVQPGYSGQKFKPDVLPKIKSLREYADKAGKEEIDITVDGGINFETACDCAKNGANKFVAGNFLYTADDMTATISKLRQIVTESFVR